MRSRLEWFVRHEHSHHGYAGFPWQSGRSTGRQQGCSSLSTVPDVSLAAPRSANRRVLREVQGRPPDGGGQGERSADLLAKKTGISRSYIAHLETARQDPKLSTLEKIAKALNVDVAKLLK